MSSRKRRQLEALNAHASEPATHDKAGPVYEQLREYIGWCLGLVLGLAFFLASKDKLLEAYGSDPIKAGLATMLLLMTFGWCFAYLQAVRKELDLLNRVLDTPRVTRLSGPTLSAGVGLAIVYAALVATCTNLLVYTACLIIFSMVDFVANWSVSRNLAIFVKQKKLRLGRESEAEILFDYYFENPVYLRLAALLVAYFCAFASAAWALLDGKPRYEYVAYGIVLAAVITGEAVMLRWRQRRDRELELLQR